MTIDEFEGGKKRRRSTRSVSTARKTHRKLEGGRRRHSRHEGEFEGGKRRKRVHRHVGVLEGGKAKILRAQTTKLIKAQSSLLKSLKALGSAKRRGVASASKIKRRTVTKKRVVKRKVHHRR